MFVLFVAMLLDSASPPVQPIADEWPVLTCMNISTSKSVSLGIDGKKAWKAFKKNCENEMRADDQEATLTLTNKHGMSEQQAKVRRTEFWKDYAALFEVNYQVAQLLAKQAKQH